MLKKIIVPLFLLLVLFQTEMVQAALLDRIVAVVEDDVILDSELTRETNTIKQRLQENKVMMPPDFILRKQVLERLILEKLQLQRAKQIGIHVSDEMVRNAKNRVSLLCNSISSGGYGTATMET